MEDGKFVKNILTIILGTALVAPALVSAYKPETAHHGLASETIKLFEHYYPEHSLSGSDRANILRGSIEEDGKGRYMHHFYDPVNDTGLVTKLETFSDAKEWAEDTIGQAVVEAGVSVFDDSSHERLYDLDSSRTWQKAIYEYVYGDRELAMLSLGHVLHLAQDMTVPPHTRNDTHPPTNPSPFEEWTNRFNANNMTVAQELIDADEGPVMLGSIGTHLEYMAGYSNNNFLSKDTLPNDKNYDVPIITSERKEKLDDGTNIIVGYGKFDQKLSQIRYVTDTKAGKVDRIYTIKDDDNLVLTNYWNLLSKKAVQHGAGIMKLFFEKVEEERRTQALKKNNKYVFELILEDHERLADMAVQRGGERTIGTVGDVGKSIFESAKTAWMGAKSVAGSTRDAMREALADAGNLLGGTLADGWQRVFDESEGGEGGDDDRFSAQTGSSLGLGNDEGEIDDGSTPQNDDESSSSANTEDDEQVEEDYEPSQEDGTDSEEGSEATDDDLAEAQRMLNELLRRIELFVEQGGADVEDDGDDESADSDSDSESSGGGGGGGSAPEVVKTDEGEDDEGEQESKTASSTPPVPEILDFKVNSCEASISPEGCLLEESDLTLSWSITAGTSTDPEMSDHVRAVISVNGNKELDVAVSSATSTPLEIDSNRQGRHTISIKAVNAYGEESETVTKSVGIYASPIVINELAWMGTRASYADEWIELHNPTNHAVPLAGYSLIATDHKDDEVTLRIELDSEKSIPAGGYYLLERSDDETISDIPADQIYSGTLNNYDPNTVKLMHGSTTVDQTAVSESCEHRRGCWPGGYNPYRLRYERRRSMERFDPLTPGDTPDNWGDSIGAIRNGKDADDLEIWGTPGRRNGRRDLVNNGSTIQEDLTLYASSSPYLIEGTLKVASSSTLTIEPGVTVKVSGRGENEGSTIIRWSNLLVEGRLVTEGAEDRPVVFTSLGDTQVSPELRRAHEGVPRWGGIYFQGTSTAPHQITGMKLKHAVAPLYFKNTDANLSDVEAQKSDNFIIALGSSVKASNLRADNIAKRFIFGSYESDIELNGANFHTGSWWKRRYSFRARGDIIGLDNASKLVARNINLANATSAVAVRSKDGSQVVVTDSFIDVPGGIHDGGITEGQTFTFKNTHFINSGIRSTDADLVTVHDSCFVSDGTGRSIALDFPYESGVDIRRNYISGYREYGLRMAWPVTSLVQHNVIVKNSIGVRSLLDSSRPRIRIYDNVIANNTEYGLEDGDWNDHQSDLNVTENYWGDASGPEHKNNPTGKGNGVSKTALIKPWLTAPPAEIAGEVESISAKCENFEGIEVLMDEDKDVDVVLNEIYPSADSDAEEELNGAEWVELYNNGSEPVDVARWRISEMSGDSEKFYTIVGDDAESSEMNTVSGTTTIPAKGFLVLTFDRLSRSRLNNSGDTVSLYDSRGTQVDTHTYPDTDKGKSHVRFPDGVGEWQDPLPTPGMPNTLEEEEEVEPSIISTTTPPTTVESGKVGATSTPDSTNTGTSTRTGIGTGTTSSDILKKGGGNDTSTAPSSGSRDIGTSTPEQIPPTSTSTPEADFATSTPEQINQGTSTPDTNESDATKDENGTSTPQVADIEGSASSTPESTGEEGDDSESETDTPPPEDVEDVPDAPVDKKSDPPRDDEAPQDGGSEEDEQSSDATEKEDDKEENRESTETPDNKDI